MKEKIKGIIYVFGFFYSMFGVFGWLLIAAAQSANKFEPDGGGFFSPWDWLSYVLYYATVILFFVLAYKWRDSKGAESARGEFDKVNEGIEKIDRLNS